VPAVVILIWWGIRSVDKRLNKPSLKIFDRVSKIIMPLKPLGRDQPKPEAPEQTRQDPAALRRRPATLPHSPASNAAAYGQRADRQVQEATSPSGRAFLLSKGPGSAREKRWAAREEAAGTGSAGFGRSGRALGKPRGLTKIDGKKGDFNQDGTPPAAQRAKTWPPPPESTKW